MPRTRKTGEGGLYFDGKRQLWIGVIDLGLTPDGKRKQKRVTSRSQSAARAKLQEAQHQVSKYGSPFGNQTVSEWGVYWLAEICKPKMKPQPFRTYQSILKTWVLPQIGKRNIKDLRPSDLRRIYDTMKAAGKSSSTQLKAHNVMSSMFEAARLERIVEINVAQDIRPPKAAKSTRNAFDAETTMNVLHAAEGRTDGSKWLFSLYAGLRQGERLGATIDSVDLERRTFTVQWSLAEANFEHGCGGACTAKVAGYCPHRRMVLADGLEHVPLKGRFVLVRPKSGDTRVVPLPPLLLDSLAAQIDRVSRQPNPYGLLWPNLDGSPIGGRQDQAEWRSLIVDAGINLTAATTHWARHTAISDLTASGVPDRVIGEIVGHKSAGVTGRYQHVSSQDASDAMLKLGQRRQPESAVGAMPQIEGQSVPQ